MSDQDSEPKPSSNSIFNFEALKQSASANMPLNFNINLNLLKPNEEPYSKPNTEEVPLEHTTKKRGPKPKKEGAVDPQSSEATIREIIENEYVGIPMTSEVKMKQEKLEKMREGKAKKKKKLKASGDENPVDVQLSEKEAGNLLNMKSVASEQQNSSMSGPKIVIKDGKAVIEYNDGSDFDKRDKSKLTVMDTSKPRKLTSSTYGKRNHTKPWMPEETRKIYKAIEMFGLDYSTIAKFFPSRNQNQIAKKIRKEEKANPQRFEDSLNKHGKKIKSMMSKIEDLWQQQYKPAIEAAPTAPIEYLGAMEPVSIANRGLSNCSIDSMDLNILADLRKILSEEGYFKNRIPGQLVRELSNPGIGIPGQLIRELSIPDKNGSGQLLRGLSLREFKGESRESKGESSTDFYFPPVPVKQVKREEEKQLEAGKETYTEPVDKGKEESKPNLFLGMLNKQNI